MKIPFVGGAYTSKSTNLNAQTCVNWYPEIDSEEGKHVLALMPTPGLKEWYDSGTGLEVRNMIVAGDYLYAVIGDSLYQIREGGILVSTDSSLLLSSGYVWMSSDGTTIIIVEPGKAGWLKTLGTAGIARTRFVGGDYNIPTSVTFQDGYYITTENDSDTIYVSETGVWWDPLDYASGEAAPDDAECVFSDQHQLWIFGEETIEVWYNSGDADFPFERMTGGVIERGIGARDSIASVDNSFFFIDNSGRVCRMESLSPKNISTRQIEYQFSKYDISDAIGWSRVQEGHEFYELTFPTSNASWSYDASTNFWHQKSSFPTPIGGGFGRHRANCYVNFKGKRLVGDYDNGKIYELDPETYKDDTSEIIRQRRTQYVHNQRKKFFVHNLEVEFEAGVGLAENDSDIGTGTDPQAMLRISDDGGHTWSNELTASIGGVGERTKRCMFRRLGGSRDRVFELSVSDPVKAVVLGADANITLGIS